MAINFRIFVSPSSILCAEQSENAHTVLSYLSIISVAITLSTNNSTPWWQHISSDILGNMFFQFLTENKIYITLMYDATAAIILV